jgi:hypothetical protein
MEMDEINEQGAASSTEPSAPVASVDEGKPIGIGSISESATSPDSSTPTSTMSSQTSSAVEAGNVDAGTAQPASSGSETIAPTVSETAAEPVAPVAAPAPAHEAVNALDRFMERVSNDFMSEGKALVEAMRAEVAKLV